MIPEEATRAHVREAIRRILRDGVPSQRMSRRHCLVADGVHLPPKYVISRAHEVATGEPLPWSRFHGGRMANTFVERRGFEVVPCGCGGAGRPGAAVPAPRPPSATTTVSSPARSSLVGGRARSGVVPAFPSPPASRQRRGQDRLADTRRFYELLERLERRIGRPRCLSACDRRMGWPKRGIYFFFERGEARSGSGAGARVVRVGTHAVTAGSETTLWDRLRQHRGAARTLGGRHRSSIFRGLVGEALARRDGGAPPASWKRPGVSKARGKSLLRLPEVEEAERVLEGRVSLYIGAMPFVWLGVGDEPSRDSDRSFIEGNAIALLSGAVEPAPDPPSATWLGRAVDRPGDRVLRSGLWNQEHTETSYNPSFLEVMEEWVRRMPDG